MFLALGKIALHVFSGVLGRHFTYVQIYIQSDDESFITWPLLLLSFLGSKPYAGYYVHLMTSYG